MNKFIIVITALLILQGCNNKPEKIKPVFLNFKLNKTNTLFVNDDLTSLSINFQPPGSNWIYFVDPKTKNLLKVNLLNNEIRHICQLSDFNVDSELFSVSEEKKEIYVSDGETIKTFSLDGSEKASFKFEYYNGYVVQISNNNIPIIRNGRVYAHYMKDDENTYKSAKFFKEPIQIEIDPKSKKAQFSTVRYPSSYQLKCYGLNFAPERLLFSKNEQLFTFAYNDTAYLYKENSKESKPYYLGSNKEHSFDYIEFKDIKKLNENVFTEFYYQTKRYSFTKVAPLSGLIVRSQMFQDKKTEKLIENVILYDTKFNYIGESKKEITTYVCVDTDKGLYNLKLNLTTKCLEIYRLSW